MSDTQDRAFCPHCGSQLGKDAVFCLTCGNPVDSGTPASSDADVAAMLAEEGIAVNLDDLRSDTLGIADNAPAVNADADSMTSDVETMPVTSAEPAQPENGTAQGMSFGDIPVITEEPVQSQVVADQGMSFGDIPVITEEPVQSQVVADQGMSFDDIPVIAEAPVSSQTIAAPPADQPRPAVEQQPEAQAERPSASPRPAKRGGGAGLIVGAIAAGLIAFGGGFAGMTALLTALKPPTGGEKPAAVSDTTEKGTEKGTGTTEKAVPLTPDDAPKAPESPAPKAPAPIEDAPTTGPLGITERFDRLALNKFLSHFSETGMFDRIRTFDRNTVNLEELDDFLLANGWQNREPLPASSNPNSREVFVPVASADAMTDFYFGRRYDWARNPNFTTENGLSFVVDDVTALGPAVADWVEQGEGNTVRVGFAAYSTPFSEMPNPEGIKHRDVENIYGLDDEGYAKTPQEMRDYMGVAPRLLGTATLEATRTDDGHWRLIMLDYRID